MPTSTKVKNLNINELTEAQYDAAVQGGVIGANELSVLTDVSYVEPSDLATVATTGDYSDLINRPTNLVSTNTAQTISGLKTFSGDITLSNTTSIKNNTGGTNYTMLYRDSTTIHVGGSTSVLKLEGSGTRPAYNNDSLALISDITGGLPSQTGNSGKFLTTDGTDASWGDIVPQLFNSYSRYLLLGQWTTGYDVVGAVKIGYQGLYTNPLGQFSVSVGDGAYSKGQYGVALGSNAKGASLASVAVGAYAVADADYAIQLGYYKTNSDANTFKVGNNNGNFEMMSADGTIPTARLTKVNSTITLTSADWSSNTQTVSVTGVTSTGIIFVSPDPTDQSAYTSAGILCTAQAAGTLTFTCDTVPSGDLSVNVVML